MTNNVGRVVDLSGIDIDDIEKWLKNNTDVRNVIKCQVIYSLYKDNSMQDVCKVFGITRETVRKWKNELRKGGLSELFHQKKVGKRSRLSVDRQIELEKLVKQKPSKYGYEEKKWTGKILSNYILKNWGIKIGVRTTQVWLKNLR